MGNCRFHCLRWLGTVFCLILSGCGDSDGERPVGRLDITANATELRADHDQPQSLQFTVRNTGPVPLSNLTARASSAMMESVTNTCAGIVLDANATCALNYRVRPTAPGQGILGLELLFSHDGTVRSASLNVPYTFSPSQWDTVAVWNNRFGNASNTGYVPVSLQVANFKLDWRRDPDRTDLKLVGITSDKERIYATANADAAVAYGSASAYAVSLHDGSVAWQRSIDTTYGVGLPAAIDGNVLAAVIVPLGSYTLQMDATTGATRTQDPIGGRLPGVSAPVVWDQGFYYLMRGNDASLRARIRNAGSPYWLNGWTFDSQANNGSEIAVDARYVYLYSANASSLVVVDRASGTPAFQISGTAGTFDALSGGPVLDDSSAHAFIARSGTVLAFDLALRRTAWSASGHAGAPAYADQTLFTRSLDGRLLNALDARTGALLWTWPAPEAIASNIVVTRTHVVVASANAVYAINRASHQSDWSYASGGTSLLISNAGKLIIADTRGSITAISLR